MARLGMFMRPERLFLISDVGDRQRQCKVGSGGFR
jgi:hypothetical protein